MTRPALAKPPDSFKLPFSYSQTIPRSSFTSSSKLGPSINNHYVGKKNEGLASLINDSKTRIDSEQSDVSLPTKAVTFGTGSQFSGSHDTYRISYGTCPDEQGRYIDICSSIIKAHSVYSGTLSFDHTDSTLDFYRPTPGAPMGSCDVELGGEDLTRGITFPSQYGHGDLIGDNGQILPSPQLSLSGTVAVDHTQKTIGIGIGVAFSSYCYGGLSNPGLVSYNENNGVLTASGGDSLIENIPSGAGLPDGQRTENNQWIVTIVESNSCPSSSVTNRNAARSNLALPSSSPSPSLSSITATTDCNHPPEANAGPDQTVEEYLDRNHHNTVQLNGVGFDEDGDSLAYSWTPATIGAPALSDPHAPNPTFTVPNIDQDTFFAYTLTVNDGKQNSLPDPVTTKVISAKIKVELDPDETTPKIGQTTFTHGRIVHIPRTPPITRDHIQNQVDGGDVDVTARVVEGIQNPSNIPIRLSFDPLVATGGHDHLATIDDNARSAFGGFVNSNAGSNQRPVLRLNGVTDNDGNFAAKFRPFNLISRYSSAGGTVGINAETTSPLSGGKQLSADDGLLIQIPDLLPLQPGNNYTLVGACPGGTGNCANHLNNHYGTAAVNTALQNIANAYHGLHPRQTLRYNDQSLVNGGVFDISGDWDPSGADGHKSHACGTDADVGFTGTDGRRIDVNDLATLTEQHSPGAFVFNEGNTAQPHYHIHFEDCQ